MISYIDIAFLALAVILVIAGACRGLLVSLLSMARVILIIPCSYFAAGYVLPYVPDEWLSGLSPQLQKAVAFFACFIILAALTGILLNILFKLQKKKGMPLRHTNAFLGGVFGLIKAGVIIITLSAVLACALEIIPKDNQFYEIVNNSYAVEYISTYNLFSIIGG